MTSYQPGEPSYAAPQDPWSDAQRVSSPPTDPIPAPPRGVFAPGKAAPVAPTPEAWQETVVHGDPYHVSGQPSSRIGLYLLVTVVVLVLGGAGGFGAWYLITERLSPQAAPTQTVPPFKPLEVQVGDCLAQVPHPSSPTNTTFQVVPCETANAVRVLEIHIGPEVSAKGPITDEIGTDMCAGVAGLTGFAWWEATRDEEDAVFCVGAPQ